MERPVELAMIQLANDKRPEVTFVISPEYKVKLRKMVKDEKSN